MKKWKTMIPHVPSTTFFPIFQFLTDGFLFHNWKGEAHPIGKNYLARTWGN